MWRECCEFGARPSIASRNGTTSFSRYSELLPFRSPFCQLQGLVLLAHWSRLTLGAANAAVVPAMDDPGMGASPANSENRTARRTESGQGIRAPSLRELAFSHVRLRSPMFARSLS